MAGSSAANADLSVEEGELTLAQSKLNEAAARLSPVLRALQRVDLGVVGADPLVDALAEIQTAVVAEIQTMGEGVSSLADYLGTVLNTMTSTDRQLGTAAGGRRTAQ